MTADRKVAAQVRTLVADLRRRKKINPEGEVLAAAAVKLAKRLDDEELAAGAAASISRELRTVIGELTAFDDPPPEPGEGSGGGEGDEGTEEDDEWADLVGRMRDADAGAVRPKVVKRKKP